MLQCKILTDADLCKLVVRFGGSGISAVAWDCDDEVDERGGLAGGWACPGWVCDVTSNTSSVTRLLVRTGGSGPLFEVTCIS